MLLAAYYPTILFFAPLYLPRYVIPVWVVLGAVAFEPWLLASFSQPLGNNDILQCKRVNEYFRYLFGPWVCSRTKPLNYDQGWLRCQRQFT